MLTKKNFVEAAALIHHTGWARGAYRTPEGQHCAIGALADVAESGNTYAVACSLTDKAYSGLLDITNFNDYDADSKEDVETLLLMIGEGFYD